MKPIVTIAIPDIAGPLARAQTLDALARNTPEAHEIILFVKEGQEQSTVEDVTRLPVPSPLEVPAALNRLLRQCPTPYILLLEAGAIVTPGWLGRLLSAFQDTTVGLSGPSTNLSWNEQQVLPRFAGTRWAGQQIDACAVSVAARYAGQQRTLNTLHSLGDFCYLFKRLVAENIGGFDEAYGAGPCWEIDFTTRTARAGFRAVWVLDAYVHRSFPSSQPWDAHLFSRNKHLYQDRFCGLRLRGMKAGYEAHCRGEACEHFAPQELITVRLDTAAQETREAEVVALHDQTHGTRSVSSDALRVALVHENNSDGLPSEHERGAGTAPHAERDMIFPLISCIMPTRNRRAFVRQALAYFERQDYPNKELIIVDDGEDQVADLAASLPNVRYVARSQQMSIGAKRNLACELARGSIIAHWDDDDWYAADRLSYQAAPLLAGQADITGLETACFFDLLRWQAWTCSSALHRRLFVGNVHGGTIVYWRRVWEHLSRYPNLTVAEDAHFLLTAPRRQALLQKLPHERRFIYVRHGGNAWRFPLGTYLDPAGWQRADPDAYLPAEDQAFYRDVSSQFVTGRHSSFVGNQGAPQARTAAAKSEEATPGMTTHASVTGNSNLAKPDQQPLVSCIMPTFNRSRYVQQSIQYFLRQDYPNRELIILDDSPQPIEELIPADPHIRYIHLGTRMILGAKRNLACHLARGPIIAHWDDDDWIAPHRLRVQIKLLEQQHAELCGAYRQLYYDRDNDKAWLYQYPLPARRIPLGNTLCYCKSLWERNPFPEIAVGEDTRFAWSRTIRTTAFLDDETFYIGIIHRDNTSRKILTGACWHVHPVEEIYCLFGTDLEFYRSSQSR